MIYVLIGIITIIIESIFILMRLDYIVFNIYFYAGAIMFFLSVYFVLFIIYKTFKAP